MARKPMVTRTLITTECTAACVSVSERRVFEKTFSVSGKTDKMGKDKLMKAIQSMCDEDTKAVEIIRTEEKETLYGMTEEDFIQNATILPPRTTNS